MRPTPLVRMMLAFAVLPMTAASAQRPTPPTAPTPAPAARPVNPVPPRPARVMEPVIADEFRLRASEMELRAREMELRAMELSHIDMERIASVAEMAAERVSHAMEIDAARIAAVSEMAAARAVDVSHIASEMAIASVEPALEAVRSMSYSQDRFERSSPRAAWAPEDPADSLYRLGRESLNRGEYRRAAQLFNEVATKYKTSQYAVHSAYWEAFARYRLGTTDELKQALAILDTKSEVGVRLQNLRRESSVDVPALRARVLGALAARGDANAARALRSEAGQANGCDREEVSVRAEALSALGQMDLNAAMPSVRRVLANRDECTVELRRRALYLLGRQPVEGRVAILLDVAKNDSDAGIRGEAMSWIARVADAQAVPMLQELLRTSTDERTQRSAITALGSINEDAARRAVRTIIEREDAPERVRYDAILTITRTRNDRQPTADDVAYLRGLYPKVSSQRLRQAILTALSRVESPENKQFFQSIVRNQNEAVSVRASAMQRLGTMSTLDELARFYDIADARSLREQILHALYERKEPEAVDKMMDIARKDTDPQIRRTAISLLARRKDPRAQQLLQELLDK